MKRLATFAALALASAAQAAPETYIIDGSHTSTAFTYRTLGLPSPVNRFERISGRIVFDPAARTGSAQITIDATSVNTGAAVLNEQFQGRDFFDTASYPAIVFRADRMTLDGDHPSLSGELTIKGVTRPVTLSLSQFRCAEDSFYGGDACGARASVTLRRSDFNMRKYAFLVGDEITLNLAIRAVRERSYLQVASRDPGR